MITLLVYECIEIKNFYYIILNLKYIEDELEFPVFLILLNKFYNICFI